MHLCLNGLRPGSRAIRHAATLFFVSCFAPGVMISLAQSAPPRIFYSDLDSGPASGGENGEGAYVTIYGVNFGAVRSGSAVQIGPTAVTNYKLWTSSKIAFQVPAAAAAGLQQITVTIGGATSNSVPFTIRAGAIYCATVSGNDSNPGTFNGGCWRTVQHAVQTMQPGDTVYVRQGIIESRVTGDGSVSIGSGKYVAGAPGYPIAIIGYPGEAAQIGGTGSGPCNTTCVEGLITYNVDVAYSYFTVANLVLRGTNTALSISGDSLHTPSSQNWRIVGNDISCPYGDGAAGCAETSRTSNVAFYGNNVHDAGKKGASTQYHAVYFSTDSNYIDAGWNAIAHVNGCYGIQFHSSPLYGGIPTDPTGHQQYALSVHDNTISDTQCSGIMFATVDPSKGKVEAFNNVIFNTGRGPFNTASYYCIDFPGYANMPPAGGGIADVYNNTLYNCGPVTAAATLDSGWGGAICNQGIQNGQPALQVRIRNNIIYQPLSGEYYWSIYNSNGEIASSGNAIIGSNNIIYGLQGSGPSNELDNPNVGGTTHSDPRLVNTTIPDLHLLPLSPAIGSGAVVQLAQDHDGVPIPTPTGYPIGAFAYIGSGPPVDPPFTISPGSVTLNAGQQQSFTATNPSVTWSITPLVGIITASGLYTAPLTIPASQQITVTATSTINSGNRATAIVTINPYSPPVSFTLSPAVVSLQAGQSQLFTAVNSAGQPVTAVTWSISPALGAITAGGLYTAPSTISASQQVTVSATSTIGPTSQATAIVTINPAPISLTLNPAAVSLQAGQSQAFTALNGAGQLVSAVNWSLNPPVGAVNAQGVYTAPATIAAQQNVLIRATSTIDVTKSATATITLIPPPPPPPPPPVSGPGLFWTLLSGDPSAVPVNLQLAWTAPATTTPYDSLALASVDAPTWWSVWQVDTNGAKSGTTTVAVTLPGRYEFRYLYESSSTWSTVTLRSAPFDIGLSGFSITTSDVKVNPRQAIRLTWTAGAGRTNADFIALYPVGRTSDRPIASTMVYTGGAASGSATIQVPNADGNYEARYVFSDSMRTGARTPTINVD